MVLALLLALATSAQAGAGISAPVDAVAEAQRPGADLRGVLEAGRRERRPVLLRVHGKDLPVTVVRLQEAAVEVRRPDHSRLLIRLDRIESAALL